MSTRFPKWNTLCLLRKLGLPTLDGALLLPSTSRSLVGSTIDEFASLLGVKRLLVRSDGGREDSGYYKGGNTLPLTEVVDLTVTLLQSQRAVILLEPTNRFQNKLTVNFLATRQGAFVVEILGPGYDTADLNRGGIPPQYTVHGDVGGWSEYRILSILDVRGVPNEYDQAERRQARLRNLGTTTLPGSGIEVQGDPAAFAEGWLQRMGYRDLWRPWQFSFDLSQIQRWYEDAFLVASYLTGNRHWEAFVLSRSVLADSRRIYWDIAEPSTKFSIPRGFTAAHYC